MLDLGNFQTSLGDVQVLDATVDITQGNLLKTIPGLTSNPIDVVFNSSGSTAYVLELGGAIDTVNPITNKITFHVLGSGGTRPSSFALRGAYLYIPDSLSKKVNVRPTSTAMPTPAPIPPIPVGNNPVGIVANPISNFVYLANAGDNTISIISTTTNKVVQTMKVGIDPANLGVSPDGKTLLVANQGNGTVSVIDASVSPAVLKASVFVAGQPSAIAVNSTSTLAYVTNYFCPLSAAVCTASHSSDGVVELVSFAVTPPKVQCCIVVGQLPGAIAFDPTGRYLWVVNSGSHSVTIIDSQTNAVFKTFFGLLSMPHSGGQFVHAVP